MSLVRVLAFRRTYLHAGTIPFWGVHVAAVAGAILVGFSWAGLVWAAALYVSRMFFVTAGYHRYFSHRSFRTSRPIQFVLALLAQTSLQRGVLWWAANHRHHHRYSDAPGDLHSARRDGFWWAHVGWILDHGDDYDESYVRDLSRFPELRMLNRVKHLPGIVLAALLLWIGGPTALVWGFFISTVLLWHGTFTINSLNHLFGSRRYATSDTSRNNAVLAAITLGEGWHNNHHHYQRSAAQGFFWWELDPTYYLLQGMQRLRLIHGLTRPPAHVLADVGATRTTSDY